MSGSKGKNKAVLRKQTHVFLFIKMFYKNLHSEVISYNYRRTICIQKFFIRWSKQCMVRRQRWIHMLAMSFIEVFCFHYNPITCNNNYLVLSNLSTHTPTLHSAYVAPSLPTLFSHPIYNQLHP